MLSFDHYPFFQPDPDGRFGNISKAGIPTNVSLDGAVYAKVEDAYRASYGIDSPTSAITTLAQSAMRKEVCSG